MRTPSPRYPTRRPHDPRRMAVRLVLWGVPVAVSALTLVYAHQILSRPRTPEADPVPSANASAPDAKTKTPGTLSDAEVARLTAQIANREAERRKTQAQARELERLKREVAQLKERQPEPAAKPEPPPKQEPKPAQPDPEVERLRREVERLKAAAAKKSEPASPPRPIVRKPEPAAMKPEPKAPSAKPKTNKEQALQELFEQAATFRKGREPGKLLKVLGELQQQRPKDPTVHFGLGEVYGSLGEHFDAKKASAEFREFLDLTAAGKLKPDSLHPASFLKDEDIKELRSETRKHLGQLRKKHKLLLVTSTSRIGKLVAGLQKELGERKKAIETHKSWIKTYNHRLDLLRRSRRFDRASRIKATKRKIKTLEKAIEREEKQLEFVTEELVMIRRETGYQK